MKRLLLLLLTLAAAPLVPLFLIRDRARGYWRRRRSKPSDTPLVSYSQVLWDDVWQRPQEFAWRTAEERAVIYCAPVQIHNWLKTLRGRWQSVKHPAGSDRRLLVLSPLVFSGHFKNRRIFDLNCRLVAFALAPWLKHARAIDCVVNTPYGLPVVEQLFGLGSSRQPRLRKLSYDVIDDFTTFDWSPSFGKDLDERLMIEADVCFTGTHELLEQRKRLRPEAEFIPCGVDFEAFSTPMPEPEDLRELPRPLIGYFGTLSDRLDLGLLDRVAREFPAATLVMVGPVHLPESVLPRGAGNVRYLGLKPHSSLPAYAQSFQVGLIPFRLTEATLKLNPVKTLEYLAAGLPVVSTAIPDVERFFSSAVLVSRDADEFIRHVGDCLSAPASARRQAGIDMARHASWQTMTERMNQLIEGGTVPPAGHGAA